MTIADPQNPQGASPARSFVRSALPALLLSTIASIACYVALGATTGFFFGAVVVATLITPPLVLAESSAVRQLLAAWAVADGVALACLFAVADPSVTFPDWLRAYVLLLAYVLALWGFGAGLVRLRVRALIASALVVVVALA